jgi:hypothetical protein
LVLLAFTSKKSATGTEISNNQIPDSTKTVAKN